MRRSRRTHGGLPAVVTALLVSDDENDGNEIVEDDGLVGDFVPFLNVDFVSSKDAYYQSLCLLMDTFVGDEVRGKHYLNAVQVLMKNRFLQLSNDCQKSFSAETRLRKFFLKCLTIPGDLDAFRSSEYLRQLTTFELREIYDSFGCSLSRDSILSSDEVVQDVVGRLINMAREKASTEQGILSRLPFLTDVSSVFPLHQLRLEEEPAFASLLAQHAALTSNAVPASGPEVLRLEKEMRDLAGRLAEEADATRRRRALEAEALHEMYPFVPEEPVPGISLVDVGVLMDHAFCLLSNELEDLRLDPVANASQIVGVERQLCARVAELAAAKQSATEEACRKYPFLGMRVEGVLLADLHLDEDVAFRELVAGRDALAADRHTSQEALAKADRSLCARAREVAVSRNAVDALRADADDAVRARHPYLETATVRTIPIRLLDLDGDSQIGSLLVKYRQAMFSDDISSLMLIKEQLMCRAREMADMLVKVECNLFDEYGNKGLGSASFSAPLFVLALGSDELVVKLSNKMAVLSSNSGEIDQKKLSKLNAKRRQRVIELMGAYESAEREIAVERQQLGRAYPMCVRTLNSALTSDALFTELERARQLELASESVDEMLVAAIERRQCIRSLSLLKERACADKELEIFSLLEDELHKARSAGCNKVDMRRTSRKRDVALYRYRLHHAQQVQCRTVDVASLTCGADETVSSDDIVLSADFVDSLMDKDSYFLFLKHLVTQSPFRGSSYEKPFMKAVMDVRRRQLYADALRDDGARTRRVRNLVEKYPFLSVFSEAISQEGIFLENDSVFTAMATEREKLLEEYNDILETSPTLGCLVKTPLDDMIDATGENRGSRLSDALKRIKTNESEMKEYCSSALLYAKASAEQGILSRLPFLTDVSSVFPLHQLRLEEEPAFASLLAQHAALTSNAVPASGPEVLRLEKEMRDLAGRLAEEADATRRRRALEAEALHEMYPFVPEEPVPGISLVDVGVLMDHAFCLLSNELEDLRLDPVANASQIVGVERQLCARVAELAAAKQSATEEACRKYPFLGMRVEGVLLADLHLDEDVAFRELVAGRDALAADRHTSQEALAKADRSLCARAREVAVSRNAVDALRADADDAVRARHPYLETATVRTIPIRLLDLDGDSVFANYREQRLKLLAEDVVDSERVRFLDDLLRARAEFVAKKQFNLCSDAAALLLARGASHVSLGNLGADLAFCAENMDWLLSRVSNEHICDDIEMHGRAFALAESSVALEARALRNKYPACAWVLNSAMESDDKFQGIVAERRLLVEGMANESLIQSVDEQLRKRGIELYADTSHLGVSRKELPVATASCGLEMQKHVNMWRKRLKERNAKLRAMTLLELQRGAAIDKVWRGEGETHGSSRRGHKGRSRGKERSVDSLIFSMIPETHIIELVESSQFSSHERHASFTIQDGKLHEIIADSGGRSKGSSLSRQQRYHQLRLRRLRMMNTPSNISVTIISNTNGCEIGEDGLVKSIDDVVGTGDSTGAAILRGALAKKHHGDVLKQRLASRRASLKNGCESRRRSLVRRRTSMDSVPVDTVGELVEGRTELLDKSEGEASTAQRSSNDLSGKMNFSKSGLLHRLAHAHTTSTPPSLEGSLAGESSLTSPGLVGGEKSTVQKRLVPLPPLIGSPNLQTLRNLQLKSMARLSSTDTQTPSSTCTGIQTSKESIAFGNSYSSRSSRRRSLERRKTHKLHFTRVQEDDFGEVPDVLNATLTSSSSTTRSTPLTSGRHVRSRSQSGRESISEVEEPVGTFIQDTNCDAVSFTMQPRRRCSFKHSKIVPSTRQEARELERERRLIAKVLGRARQFVSRKLTAEEVESDLVAMSLVFKHEDISQAYSLMPSALADAYIRDVETDLVQRVVAMSKESISSGASARGVDIRERRRERLTAARSTVAGDGVVPVLDVHNPRNVPHPWAHLSEEELSRDKTLRIMLDRSGDGEEERKEALRYLCDLSKQKQIKNEALFEEYPFIPPLPCGVPLTETGFNNDTAFNLCAMELGMSPNNRSIQEKMRRIVLRLAEGVMKVPQHKGARKEVLPQLHSGRFIPEDSSGAAADVSSGRGGDSHYSTSLHSSASSQQTWNRLSKAYQNGDFLDNWRLQSLRLVEQFVVHMERERKVDIPLSMEELKASFFLFDSLRLACGGLLESSDMEEFVTSLLGGPLQISRGTVRMLLESSAMINESSHIIDFSDFTKFYHALASREYRRESDHEHEQPFVSCTSPREQSSTTSPSFTPATPPITRPYRGPITRFSGGYTRWVGRRIPLRFDTPTESSPRAQNSDGCLPRSSGTSGSLPSTAESNVAPEGELPRTPLLTRLRHGSADCKSAQKPIVPQRPSTTLR
ncbi:hypothetical protein ERJ75_000926800 [Trypanosoma vivax]|nr:hypothetical protein ERJ75_000926800 [Trypanosoma vivax]